MDRNLGIADAWIRWNLVLWIVIIAVLSQQYYIGLIAFPLFLTAISGFCPIYNILGIKTCSTNE